MYELHESLFDELDSFGIPNTDNQKLFNNITIFDFASICLEDEELKDTKTPTRIGKQLPNSVSISSNLIPQLVFLCDPNIRDLVSPFIDALENLATQSKAQIKMNFFQNETAIKSKLTFVLEVLNQLRGHCGGIYAVEDNS